MHIHTHTLLIRDVLNVIFVYYLLCSVKKAISIVNELEGSKFGRILARVLQKLHMKVLYVCVCASVRLCGWMTQWSCTSV